MSNIGGRFGGAITAALFLKEYVDFEKVQAGTFLYWLTTLDIICDTLNMTSCGALRFCTPFACVTH